MTPHDHPGTPTVRAPTPEALDRYLGEVVMDWTWHPDGWHREDGSVTLSFRPDLYPCDLFELIERVEALGYHVHVLGRSFGRVARYRVRVSAPGVGAEAAGATLGVAVCRAVQKVTQAPAYARVAS